MEYKRLGTTGLKVSRICVGTMSYGSSKWSPWVLDETESISMIKKAYDAGINFFDTADAYSNGESERILGKAIRELNIPRENVVIASKVYFPVAEDITVNTFRGNLPKSVSSINAGGLSRKHIFDAIDASLKRLQMDYIDLYQIHRWDYDTPIEETMEALNDLVRSGKYDTLEHHLCGHGNFKEHKIFSSMQNLYNLVYREEEREMIPLCIDQGVGIIPYSPLAKGILNAKTESSTRRETDTAIKTRFYSTDAQEAILERMREIASKKQVTPAQIAIAWLLSKPGVTAPIVGMSKPEYLDSVIGALKIQLTDEEVKSLEEPYQPRVTVGFV